MFPGFRMYEVTRSVTPFISSSVTPRVVALNTPGTSRMPNEERVGPLSSIFRTLLEKLRFSDPCGALIPIWSEAWQRSNRVHNYFKIEECNYLLYKFFKGCRCQRRYGSIEAISTIILITIFEMVNLASLNRSANIVRFCAPLGDDQGRKSSTKSAADRKRDVGQTL